MKAQRDSSMLLGPSPRGRPDVAIVVLGSGAVLRGAKDPIFSKLPFQQSPWQPAGVNRGYGLTKSGRRKIHLIVAVCDVDLEDSQGLLTSDDIEESLDGH